MLSTASPDVLPTTRFIVGFSLSGLFTASMFVLLRLSLRIAGAIRIDVKLCRSRFLWRLVVYAKRDCLQKQGGKYILVLDFRAGVNRLWQTSELNGYREAEYVGALAPDFAWEGGVGYEGVGVPGTSSVVSAGGFAVEFSGTRTREQHSAHES